MDLEDDSLTSSGNHDHPLDNGHFMANNNPTMVDAFSFDSYQQAVASYSTTEI
jgi:hypothetical protein